jgi:hypothetical protein
MRGETSGHHVRRRVGIGQRPSSAIQNDRASTAKFKGFGLHALIIFREERICFDTESLVPHPLIFAVCSLSPSTGRASSPSAHSPLSWQIMTAFRGNHRQS